MKVIGTVGKESYLVEATVEELAALADKPITTRAGGGYDRVYDVVQLGTEFRVKDAFRQIYRNDDRKREVEMLRQAIKGMLSNLDMMDPFVNEPKVESKSEADQTA